MVRGLAEVADQGLVKGKAMVRARADRAGRDAGRVLVRATVKDVGRALARATARDKGAKGKAARDKADKAAVAKGRDRVVQDNPIHCRLRLDSPAWGNLDAVLRRIVMPGRRGLAEHRATRPACRGAGRAAKVLELAGRED